jgi:hypothetical protein
LHHDPDNDCYRARSEDPESPPRVSAGRLQATPVPIPGLPVEYGGGPGGERIGLRIELRRTGLRELLAMLAVSRAHVVREGLVIEPEVNGLFRELFRELSREPVRGSSPGDSESGCEEVPTAAAWSATLAAIPGLDDAMRLSPMYRRAVAYVRRQRGRVRVHENLLVLRIDDPRLRTLIDRRFVGQTYPLGELYRAVPRALEHKVLALARRQGLIARRMS